MPSESVTPKTLFANRRQWIKTLGLTASLPMTAAIYRALHPVDHGTDPQPALPNLVESALSYREQRSRGYVASDALSSLYDATHLNNFHEFTTEQENVWNVAKGLKPTGWTVRIDEAMHPLTILATGMYGERLPPQNGAPLRLVVPRKYGIKSIKSIVHIKLVAEQPVTAWHQAAAHENGFYANVNPAVDHPRWSQATERRVGDLFRRDTLPFNGYSDQVASLYRGMDLSVNY